MNIKKIASIFAAVAIVTSLISLTWCISFFVLFKLQICDMKYIIPTHMAFGVCSGIKFILSTILIINKQYLRSSSVIFNLEQYLSTKS